MPVCVQLTIKMKSQYCLFAGCESGKKKFGLWQAENLTEKRTVMLLSNVSPPLTVATEDNAMQFLTHEHYSGTGKSKSVYQKYD